MARKNNGGDKTSKAPTPPRGDAPNMLPADITPWPTKLGDAGKIVAQKLRGEEVDNALLYRAGWHTIGFASGMFMPSGSPPPRGVNEPEAPEKMSNEQAAEALEATCVEERRVTGQDALKERPTMKAINWLAVVTLVLPIVQKLLVDWLSQE